MRVLGLGVQVRVKLGLERGSSLVRVRRHVRVLGLGVRGEGPRFRRAG